MSTLNFDITSSDGIISKAQGGGLAVDPSDGSLLVADTGNHCIKRVTTTGTTTKGQMTVVVGVPGESATASTSAEKLNTPWGVTVSGNRVYIADRGVNAIRVWDATAAQRLSTVPTPAPDLFQLNSPQSVLASGSTQLFVADSGNHVSFKLVAGACCQFSKV